MAPTRIADIIVPEVFAPYVIERTTQLSALWASGIIGTDELIQARVNGGGRLINLPFFTDLSGESEILSDSNPLTVNAIGSNKDVAAKHFRGKAWGVNDLAKALAGDDPMAAVGDLVAAFWARDMQKVLISSLQGVIASNIANDGGDMVHSIASESIAGQGPDTKISAEAIVEAMHTMGDHWDDLAAIAMHSVPFKDLQKQDLIDFIKDSENDVEIPTYLGKRVIVDDSCPVRAGTTDGWVYTTFLFGYGAIAYADANIPEAVETDRDSLQGDDVLIHRRHFILHPRGVKWTDASCAGNSPTNTELELATNWSRVYERKNVRIAALITN